MIALIVTFIAGFPGIIFFSKGKILEGVICVGIVVVAWVLHNAAVSDARAYVHRRDYWAMSGRDRVLARRQWEAEADAETERRLLRSVSMREKERLRNEAFTFTCDHCRTKVVTYGYYSTVNGRLIRRYDCPKCGHAYFMERNG